MICISDIDCHDAEYEYSNAKMILVKSKDGKGLDGGVEYIEQFKSYQRRDGHLRTKGISAGKYFLFIELFVE